MRTKIFKVKKKIALNARERRACRSQVRRLLRAWKQRWSSLPEAAFHKPGRWLRERRLHCLWKKAAPWEFRGTSAGPWENRYCSLRKERAPAPEERPPS